MSKKACLLNRICVTESDIIVVDHNAESTPNVCFVIKYIINTERAPNVATRMRIGR